MALELAEEIDKISAVLYALFHTDKKKVNSFLGIEMFTGV